jgi:hypothetical protein
VIFMSLREKHLLLESNLEISSKKNTDSKLIQFRSNYVHQNIWFNKLMNTNSSYNSGSNLESILNIDYTRNSFTRIRKSSQIN